ncbi:MAG: restriction endonuclease [Peptococcales bacterium]
MQFLIGDFYDSESRHPIEYSDHILSIKDNFLIIKKGNRYTGKFVELYKKSFLGWHNIRISQNKYVNIEADILTQDDNGKNQLEHYHIAFIPLQTYSLDKFFVFLNELNKNNLNEEEASEILKRLKLQEAEAKRQLSIQLKQNLILSLICQLKKIRELKIHELITKKAEEEKRIKRLELERQALVKNFTNMIRKLKENREMEKVFLNYFKKYIKNTFLSPAYYNALACDMLKDNCLFEEVKRDIPSLSNLSIGFVNPGTFRLVGIDKLVEFMSRIMNVSSKDYAKLLTWIEICDVAMTYYSNCFYELYGKQINNIENLSLRDAILRYVHSDILDDENTQGMFVYFLMSLRKFGDEDFNRGYIDCIKAFMNIYEELKHESEYDRFINSLLVKEQPDENNYTIDDIDLMTGSEFEKFISELFKKIGYKTLITKASGDQGVDVVAEKGGIRYAIQAKCYSGVVSNSAIQEVVAGSIFHKCDKAIVITNSYFTSSAIELAKANEVILWDREMLKQKILDLYS